VPTYLTKCSLTLPFDHQCATKKHTVYFILCRPEILLMPELNSASVEISLKPIKSVRHDNSARGKDE
jgi:hypothetical protein